MTFGKELWIQQLHSTLCSPRPLFFLFIPLGGSLKDSRPPMVKWMCFRSRAYLTAPPRPAPCPSSQCPAEELEAAGLISLRNWDGISFQERQVWHLTQAPDGWLQVLSSQLHPPNLSKAQAIGTTLSEHGAGWVHPLGIPPSGPTEWHHQLLAMHNPHQLRETGVVPLRDTLTLSILLCLKKASRID